MKLVLQEKLADQKSVFTEISKTFHMWPV